MKNRILKTLFFIALWALPIMFINRATEVTQKYTALSQFDNTESSFQLFQATSNISYLNYFIIVCMVFHLASIWKPTLISNH